MKKSYRELAEYAPKLIVSGRKVQDLGISKNKKTLSSSEIELLDEIFYGDQEIFKNQTNREWLHDVNILG